MVLTVVCASGALSLFGRSSVAVATGAVAAVGGSNGAVTSVGVPAAKPPMTSTCIQDDAIPTPRSWQGWDRSAAVAWEAIEQAGGVVPEIEEDRTQAPPAWWRYPSAVRSELLLDAEARNSATGLYTAVPPTELARGDILVRARGAGVCGKMALIGGQVDGQWVTIEVGPDGRGPSMRPASPLFFTADGRTLLPNTRAFRVRVKKDETIGHIRELRRDLEHLDRTVGHRPPLLAPGDEAREAVSEKVHDLVDEAWSLVAEESYDLDRRELTGRALALGARLGWPAAAVSATAVLDDVLTKSGDRAAAKATRSALDGLGPGAGAGADADGRKGGESSAPGNLEVRFFATPDEVGIESLDLGFQIRWPLTWRVLGLSANTETGVLANLATGRVLLPDGHADRGAAVLLAQRSAGATARAALVRDGARKMFPTAKLKTLPAVVPASRRQEFHERQDGSARAGEVTTVDRGGVVTFLVLNAPADVYPKLRDEYTRYVRSLQPVVAGAGSDAGSRPARSQTHGAGAVGAAGAGAGAGAGGGGPSASPSSGAKVGGAGPARGEASPSR